VRGKDASFSILSCILAAIVMLLSFAVIARAQQPLDNVIFTAGTTTPGLQQTQWSYLMWMGTKPDLIKGRTFAVYAKSGAPDSAQNFTRRSVVRLQTDPNVIDVLLNRSVNLGQNLYLLDEQLNNLFQQLMPPAGAPLKEKLSIAIRSSLDDPKHFQNLISLGRLHPGVSLCLGYAFAENIPATGQVTYEIRQFDPAKDQNIGVVGRVTVEAGAPTLLPAPGAPAQVFEVPKTSARGHLNAKFRWATPDDLRRLAPMHYGYNLYRVTNSFALANNWHINPPGPDVLAQYDQLFLNNPTNPPVKRVSRAPILPSKLFTAADVGNFDTNNLGDDRTFFAHDDNRRYEPGGMPFNDGDQYYYFVTARDILGRDGFTSPGLPVTICDRLPPDSPRDLKVENDYTKLLNVPAKQVLKLSWKQNVDSITGSNAFYYVYRWTNYNDYLRDNLPPGGHPNLAGIVAHNPAMERGLFVDDGPNAPKMPQDAGRTFWYTVRAQEKCLCDTNLSAHSGPAFGVLRDREGPGGPNGILGINCCGPVVTIAENHDVAQPEANAQTAYYRPYCDRGNPAIEWAEFYVFGTAPSNRISRVYYFGNESRVGTQFALPRATALNTQMVFYCRVGNYGGKVSPFRQSSTGVPAAGWAREVACTNDIDCTRVAITGKADRCDTHEPNPPGVLTNECVDLLINLAAGTKEVKVYRRVDFGSLTLLDQVSTTNLQLTIKDCLPLAIPGEVCYFAQAFDEHGNASPMVQIGDCIKFSGTGKIGKPLLSPVDSEGTTADPHMQLRWFCPPYGIERFEVSIAIAGNIDGPTDLSPMLSPLVRIDPDVVFKIHGAEKIDHFAVFRTPTVGPNFGEGASFSVTLPAMTNRVYYVIVRPIGKDGSGGQPSNAEEFHWNESQYVPPLVPWPERPLPEIGAAFHPGLLAMNLSDDRYPAGIRVGDQVPLVGYTAQTNGRPILQGLNNPVVNFYKKPDGQTVLPVALYRYQVPNASFPNVSGDLTQVSPLMETIAAQVTTMQPWGLVTIVHDPFVLIRPLSPGSLVPSRYDIFLLDTQPVIAGARYAYLLVRFGANREIEEVIPTNEVEL
jgi:hypothetical protein